MAACWRNKRCLWGCQGCKLQVGSISVLLRLASSFLSFTPLLWMFFSSLSTRSSASFTPPVFKINTWHQISPKYTQVGHPKLCCSSDVRFACPFNKGLDPHCLSALPLFCQEAFLSLPYKTGWTFSPCKHCSTSVHAEEHQSPTSQKPFWLCVTKCTAEEPARGQEFPQSQGWEEPLQHNATVTRITFS